MLDYEIAGGLPHWDLRDLYDPVEAAIKIDQDIDKAIQLSLDYAAKYYGNLKDGNSNVIKAAIKDYEEVIELINKLQSFAFLNAATDRSDSAKLKLQSHINEKLVPVAENLIFFSLELGKIPNEKLQNLLLEPGMMRYKTWFDQLKALEPYRLSEEVERVLHLKGEVSQNGWVQLFDRLMASLRFDFEGKALNSTELLDLTVNKDRTIRQDAYLSFAKVLKDNELVLTSITNNLAKGKAVGEKIRGAEEEGVMHFMNLANNIEGSVVDSLIETVRKNYPDLSHRYYKLKAEVFGEHKLLESDAFGKYKLEFWDRNAPWPASEGKFYSFEEAKEIVLNAYRQFSPAMAEIANKFFEKNWIDAGVLPSKYPGAFSHPVVPSVHPYVLVNYQGQPRDVMTLAHELGHGIHQYLAREQGVILADTPLTLAETASIFGEMLTFQYLLERANPGEKVQLLVEKVEDSLNSIVRQIAFCIFEKELHEARQQGELSSDDIAKIWMETQGEALGPAMNLSEEYKVLWSYIPHFIHKPFYVYSYAFGNCLVNTLYHLYETTDNKEEFVATYMQTLAAGGSQPYTALLEDFGLNPHDPDFWQGGLDEVSHLIDQLEAAL